MTQDQDGEIINSPETYKEIAEELEHSGKCIIGWTDELGTHFDILFTLRPIQYGNLQGGVRGATDLFVSIMRMGAFGFKANAISYVGYYDEKLGGGCLGSTAPKLAELINGIRGDLKK